MGTNPALASTSDTARATTTRRTARDARRAGTRRAFARGPRPGRLAAASLALVALGSAAACTKTNEVGTGPGATNAPAATAAPGTTPGTTDGTTRGTTKGTTKRTLPTVPASKADKYEATETAENGKQQQLSGAVLCRTLDDGQVRIIFGENVDFRLTFPEDLGSDGTIELFDDDKPVGDGTARINAEEATVSGSKGLNFGFSASFRFGDQTGTIEGSGACHFAPSSSSTTSTSRAARTTTSTRPVKTPSITVKVPTDNATGLARDLVSIAKETYEPGSSWRPGEAWVAAGIPGSALAGYGVKADGTRTVVSGMEPLVDKKANQDYVAFAVADTHGDCAYGLLVDTGTELQSKVEGTEGTCTGSAAATFFGIG